MRFKESASDKKTFTNYVRGRFKGYTISKVNTIRPARSTFPGVYEATLVDKNKYYVIFDAGKPYTETFTTDAKLKEGIKDFYYRTRDDDYGADFSVHLDSSLGKDISESQFIQEMVAEITEAQDSVVATVRVVSIDDVDEDGAMEFEYPDYDIFINWLDNKVVDYKYEGNAFSIEADKTVISNFKKFVESKTKLPKNYKIDVEWGYWIDD